MSAIALLPYSRTRSRFGDTAVADCPGLMIVFSKSTAPPPVKASALRQAFNIQAF
jgi:hypothetical protein